jgi:hypothetical protein
VRNWYAIELLLPAAVLMPVELELAVQHHAILARPQCALTCVGRAVIAWWRE